MMTENEMAGYYARRASEYERIYQKPERQDDLRQLESTIAECFVGCDLLEVACGTGYWTQFACRSAKSIVASDFNDEVIQIAKEKNYGTCPVSFVRADAYTMEKINGPFSAALVGFWWSHIPKTRLEMFLKVLHSKLIDGATVIMLDNRYIEGSSTPISRKDDDDNSYQMRSLSDGSTYEVLKNFPTREEFIQMIKPFSTEPEFTELDYFWLSKYIKK